MKYNDIREEELKNKVGVDYFSCFDTTQILGNIDFCVCPAQGNLFGYVHLLWAEAKIGDFDLVKMFVQLILTIGKARTFDKTSPPAFLGAFDFKKIGFIPYLTVQDIFYINDFNWNVTPSDHSTKEFQLIKSRIETTLEKKADVYEFIKDDNELKIFIKNNLANGNSNAKIHIDQNNFLPIYLRWVDEIKTLIGVNWDEMKDANILDADFFLADIFVEDKNTSNTDDDVSTRDNLFVVYQNSGYRIAKKNIHSMFDAVISIKNIDRYQSFWKRYKRPPIKMAQDYIIERRDLLVPQDLRERKGAFFTPRAWVELSQKYLTTCLGEQWQDDFVIWDCAAGTGNLLMGLTNKYKIYASTLDMADVKVMHDRIDKGANLLKNNTFQFDFLNDAFSPKRDGGKLPDKLYDVINDPEQRKKLLIYINPPYAEATNAKTVTGTGSNKDGVTTNLKINDTLKPKIGPATNEIFALFMAIIHERIKGCILGQFSTLKFVNGSNFKKFKTFFLADYKGGFISPADTFDNVKGQFPIGFTVWNTDSNSSITQIQTDIFELEIEKESKTKVAKVKGKKKFYGDLPNSINKWIKLFDKKIEGSIGFMENPTPDFQNNKFLNISTKEGTRHNNYLYITKENLIIGSIYFAVRQCIKATWINDRDQFLYPIGGWQTDKEFQTNCLTFALFDGQNRISSIDGVNHWIPFAEKDVNPQSAFKSSFMYNFIQGKLGTNVVSELLENENNISIPNTPLIFSDEAKSVFEAGRDLWVYYHKQDDANPDASLYDIRSHFQGQNKGRMKSKSDDENYTILIARLRDALKLLAKKIEIKVYAYEFLRV